MTSFVRLASWSIGQSIGQLLPDSLSLSLFVCAKQILITLIILGLVDYVISFFSTISTLSLHFQTKKIEGKIPEKILSEKILSEKILSEKILSEKYSSKPNIEPFLFVLF